MTDTRRRRFQLQTCLGSGAFGEVYRAVMTSPGGIRSTVAVKILHAAVNEQGVRRLRDEARWLGALDHPSIVKVHDLTRLDDCVALVAEYVDGQDLEGCFRSPGGVPPKVLVEILGRLASALDQAWNGVSSVTGEPLQLVHRDIKPMNVRIGRHGTVKLLDFGVARAAGIEREAETQAGVAIGTWRYLAPEALAGERNHPATDVFALGCTGYRVLAGKSLYDDIAMIVQKQLSSEPARHTELVANRLSLLPPSTPPGLAVLLGKMLAFNPAERPTAGEVGAACDALLDGLTGEDLRRWCAGRAWPDEVAQRGRLVGRELIEGAAEASDLRPPSEVATAMVVRDEPTPAPSEGGNTRLLVGLAAFAVLFALCAGVGGCAMGWGIALAT